MNLLSNSIRMYLARPLTLPAPLARSNQRQVQAIADEIFSSIAVAYDKEDQVRFITAFVQKAAVKEKTRFAEVGDLTKAKAEITEPHYRYIWEVPAQRRATQARPM